MKPSAALFTGALASVIPQYSGTTHPWRLESGSALPRASLKAAHAACDAICAGGDNGKSSKISNPDMIKGKMGQEVKAKCRMRNDNDKEPVEISELI